LYLNQRNSLIKLITFIYKIDEEYEINKFIDDLFSDVVIYTKDNKPYSFSNSMIFSKLDDAKKWEKMSDNEKIEFMKLNVDSSKYYSRAEWIKTCGPEVGKGVSTQAVWSGLNKYV
jgi:hypothetical protein